MSESNNCTPKKVWVKWSKGKRTNFHTNFLREMIKSIKISLGLFFVIALFALRFECRTCAYVPCAYSATSDWVHVCACVDVRFLFVRWAFFRARPRICAYDKLHEIHSFIHILYMVDSVQMMGTSNSSAMQRKKESEYRVQSTYNEYTHTQTQHGKM